jgi:hypothetical protein
MTTTLSKEIMLALDAAEEAAGDYERLVFAARAALVKRNIQIRRAYRAGAGPRLIALRTSLSRDSVGNVVKGPEPELRVPPGTRSNGIRT